MHRYNKQPIEIGRLQRFAMESIAYSDAPLPFTPAPDTGKSVACIGGGPASLACAAELRRHGIRAHIFDAHRFPAASTPTASPSTNSRPPTAFAKSKCVAHWASSST